MNREIKFRAWDKEAKRWLRPEDFDEGFLFLNWCLDKNNEGVFYIHDRSPSGIENIILMQFTGLFDKNKKPIYEGDICIGIWDGDLDYTKQKVTIEYSDGAFVESYFGSNIGNQTSRRTGNTIEVIGNIHENPELLKG